MRRLLEEAGIHVVLTPECAPNANAHAERFVRSIKDECLDRMIPMGEHHFRRAVAEYVEHYTGTRPAGKTDRVARRDRSFIHRRESMT